MSVSILIREFKIKAKWCDSSSFQMKYLYQKKFTLNRKNWRLKPSKEKEKKLPLMSAKAKI